MKSIQNVKYDSATGKMYEELGASSSSAISGLSTGASHLGGARTADYSSYHNSYQSYPYAQVPQAQYMGSFSGTYGAATSHQLNPYDR